MELSRATQPVALVVDDEPQMRYIVTFALETQSFTCLNAGSAEEAWELLRTRQVDLVILDVMLPGLDGVDLCRRIRATSDVPIILLTAMGDEEHRITGLESGVDDYVTKPFSPRELALRATAVLRRSGTSVGDVVVNGPLRVVPATGEVTWGGEALPLPDTEVRLLAVLARHAGTVLEWTDLLNTVWETAERAGGKEMVRTTVYRLRRHLERRGVSPEVVVAIRGRGYTMPNL
ncbi:response regulator transcription factor [Actinomyces trachealis]|uniref:response regulator transcription factor n=1 Tax=Actinomyces trachealis TaxID=2763540 RepID=UPI0022A77EE9|nr:response regulator transcription factor [Actinomyces trachealis]